MIGWASPGPITGDDARTFIERQRLFNEAERAAMYDVPAFIERAERLTEIVSSLFYVPEHRDRLESYFEGISEEEVFEAKANIQAHGREATPYGQPLDFWKEFLGLEGLLSDIPGDLKHPDVFQE